MDKVKCVVCGKPLKENAIMIYGRGICNHCENRILNCDVNTDFYNYYIECIKRTIVDSVKKRGEIIHCTDCHY